MFSEGLKLSTRSDIYTTWGMARAGLSGSEPGADLSAWLAKIMARLSGSTAPSRAVYITTQQYPSVVRLYSTSHLTSTWRPSSILIDKTPSPNTYRLRDPWRKGLHHVMIAKFLNTYQPTIYPPWLRPTRFLIHSLAMKFSSILDDMCVSYVLLALSPLTSV